MMIIEIFNIAVLLKCAVIMQMGLANFCLRDKDNIQL
jgi:hypothetical protein